MAGYTYVPYKKSDNVINLENTSNSDASKLRKYYENPYVVGAGGLNKQLNTTQKEINKLNKNAPSLKFNYGKKKQKNLNNAINDIVTRDPFSYDMDNDVLFQQAKNQFQALGKTAMVDTIGQASSMTGGYGNSYATTAGAQAYNNYLQQLNSSVGDYYAMALSAYNTETDRLNNVYNTLSTDKANELNEWQAENVVFNDRMAPLMGIYSDYLNLDANLYQNRGEGLKTIAGLSADAYQNAYNNEFSAYTTGENLKLEQNAQALEEAKFAETQKQNAFDRAMAVSNSSTTKKKKNKKTKPIATDATEAFIREYGDANSYNAIQLPTQKDGKLSLHVPKSQSKDKYKLLYAIDNSDLSKTEKAWLYQYYEDILPEE